MNNTTAWKFQTWVAFILSFGITLLGIAWLPVPLWPKAFLGMGFLFTVAQCFTLAKTVRDEHEAQKIHEPADARTYRQSGAH